MFINPELARCHPILVQLDVPPTDAREAPLKVRVCAWNEPQQCIYEPCAPTQRFDSSPWRCSRSACLVKPNAAAQPRPSTPAGAAAHNDQARPMRAAAAVGRRLQLPLGASHTRSAPRTRSPADKAIAAHCCSRALPGNVKPATAHRVELVARLRRLRCAVERKVQARNFPSNVPRAREHPAPEVHRIVLICQHDDRELVVWERIMSVENPGMPPVPSTYSCPSS